MATKRQTRLFPFKNNRAFPLPSGNWLEMSHKTKKPMTPKQMPNSNTPSGKMKQLSLMSFFKPAKKVLPSTPIASSPSQDVGSDKENDHTINTSLTETPLTSEMDITSDTIQSSPIKLKVARHLTNSRRTVKKVKYTESDDEEEIVSKRRRKVIDSDDDDEEDFMPDIQEDEDLSDFVVDDDDNDSLGEVKSKVRKVVQRSPNKIGKSQVSKFSINSNELIPVLKKKHNAGISKKPSSSTFTKENEERYQWLVNIKDNEKRSIDDPDYDPRTLYVPPSAWEKFTPFEKQYWEIKSKMWDTVVFFKKGKFYELYENDAIIANTKFDLKIAGGGRANMKLAGIPEMSFDYWAKEFINNGYKIARVDQKETLLAKEMRGGGSKEEKIIKRELTGILTGGTLTDLYMISDDMAIYCLSIKEINHGLFKQFGVVFVDTSTSELNYIEFNDDMECTKLDTLITQIRPKEVLCEKNNLCSIAMKILKFNNPNQLWNTLIPNTEFWSYDKTIHCLDIGGYYDEVPESLNDLKLSKIAFNAFGGLLYYLQLLKLDQSILTLQNFKRYEITKNSATHLILDGVTLNNLELLNNNYDSSDKGTLLKMINRASTAMGKRMIKNWLLHPLLDVSQINARLDAIDYLMNQGLEVRNFIETNLTGLPDLERLLSRIHSGNLKFRDFLRVIESFEKINTTLIDLRNLLNNDSGLLYKLVEQCPDISEIKQWENSFDRKEALQDIIVPNEGFDLEFDESVKKMNYLESQLNERLKEYQKQFKSYDICYKDSGKEIFLIELPNKIKNVPNDWHTMGSTSKVKRYWSPVVKKLVRELLEQRELHKMICEDLKLKLFRKFDKSYSVWVTIINIFSKIDCLIALTRASETIGYPSCRPKFVDEKDGFIEFKQLRNPIYSGQKEFIPNDIKLGQDEAKFGLLTGANAAGKSTIMRTTALAVILSQVGCYVPCSEATLTPVDRIMTRLGANDNILQGKSTFFVELSETKKIVDNATPKSLVILDELGRGGSSSDGYAIAEAVLHQLATHINCLGFFATHFNTLGISFETHPQIKPLRMAIIADASSRNITFLYKLEAGVASGSFGMNVAAMCGIPSEIVVNAEIAAQTYEKTSNLKKIKEFNKVSLGLQSDYSWLINDKNEKNKQILMFNKETGLKNIFNMIQ